MNLCRCEKGHFYDREKYASCPHCAGGMTMDEGRTEAFDGYGDMGGFVTEPAPAAQNNGMNYDLPVAGLSGAQDTLPAAGGYDTPTMPLTPDSNQNFGDIFGGGNGSYTEPVSEPEDDETDHTIGFFGDEIETLFAKKGPAKQVASSNYTTPVSKPVVNKVSSPCVGWLIAMNGNHIGTDFRLKTGKNYIGRKETMDVALTEDMTVSRASQAVVIYEPKQHLYIAMQGEASSLVYHNGDVVLTPTPLKAYDILTVGEINLLFMPLCGPEFNWTDTFAQMRK